MQNLAPNFTDKDFRHFTSRAYGSRVVSSRNPSNAMGYTGNPLRVTRSNTNYKDSVGSERFMDLFQKKYANSHELIGANRARFLSRNDEF